MVVCEVRAVRVAIAVVAMLLVVACATQSARRPVAAVSDPPFDVLIRGGRVIDGTGAPWFYADVGVREGRVAAIGHFPQHAAQQVIEAKGSVVSPGFIDMHSHSDLALIKDGRGLSKIRQGVTTEIIGEGESVAPRNQDGHDTRLGVKPDWTTLREYFQRLQAGGTSGNVMSYISAGQLRTYVMGEGARRRATPAELEQMKQLLAQVMEDGAAGLVMALETPGEEQFPPEGQQSLSMPTTDDLIELAKVVARYGGI